MKNRTASKLCRSRIMATPTPIRRRRAAIMKRGTFTHVIVASRYRLGRAAKCHGSCTVGRWCV